MRKYYLTVIGYYRNSDTTHETVIECDGVKYSEAGCYEFWIREHDAYIAVAYYPIRQTIISKIEYLEQ